MDWGGDASLAGYKSLAGETVHRHHWRVAEKTTEFHSVANILADDGDDKSCGARYVLPAKEPLPQDACVCFRTRHFVFFR